MRPSVPRRQKVRLFPWDTTNYLKTEEDIADYLEAIREENEPKLLEFAEREVERARARWCIKSPEFAAKPKS